MKKLFGSERVPWGLANQERKFVPSWEKEDYETYKRIKEVDCLSKMTKLRDDVRHKILNG